MESKVKSPDQSDLNIDSLKLVAQGESIVQERVRKEVDKIKEELSSSSTLFAALLGLFLSNTLTYMERLPLTGDSKYFFATVVGLILGAVLGERIMLVGFGILLGLNLAGLGF